MGAGLLRRCGYTDFRRRGARRICGTGPPHQRQRHRRKRRPAQRRDRSLRDNRLQCRNGRKPGELKGHFLSAHAIGTIRINGENGVYGTTRTHFSGQLREIAFAQEVVTGPAEIWATIEGETPRAYRIQIERVSDADPRRNLVIRVTDLRFCLRPAASCRA